MPLHLNGVRSVNCSCAVASCTRSPTVCRENFYLPWTTLSWILRHGTTNWRMCGLQAAVVRKLESSARKRSHTDAIKHFPPLFINLKRLEHLSHLLSTGEETSVQTPDVVECVLNYAENNPGVSTRQMATELNVPRITVWRVLNEQVLCPHCTHRVQGLKATVRPARETLVSAVWSTVHNLLFFCQFSFQMRQVLIEKTINFHSHQLYTADKLRSVSQSRHRQQFSINVWTGNVGQCLLGPHILPCRLTGNHYRDHLLNDLPDLLEDVPLAIRECIWFSHDGFPGIFIGGNILNNTYHIPWIHRERPTAWPPPSPDLNTLDFCLWEHIKCLVYTGPVDNVRQWVMKACQIIRKYPRIFERVRHSAIRRVQAYIKSHGEHFEQFL